MQKPIKVAITGGIGSGKSTVCRVFEAYGIPVYYSDIWARVLQENDPNIIEKIIKEFGHKAYTKDGKLNTEYISNIVFTTPSKLAILNSIVHYAVINHFEKWAEQQNTNLVLFESAIIFGNNLEHFFHKTIAVLSPEPIRIERVMRRSALSESQIVERIRRQMPEKEIQSKADFTIQNQEYISVLLQIEDILSKLLP